MDKFSTIRLFQQVIDKGSYAAAAQSLGLSPSTVSKAISRLETEINIQLIHRDSRKLQLTDAGRRYWQASSQLLQQLEETELELSQGLGQAKGRLKINLPVSYGRLYIIPLLEKFSRQYPDIQLDISLNDAYVDLIGDGYDLGIRSGTLQDSQLLAQQLSPIDFLICAAADDSKNISQPLKEKDFDQYPWLQFRYRQSGKLLDIMTRKGIYQPKNKLMVDDGEALADLCAQGLGLCQLPHFIVRDYLHSGKLKVVSKPFRPPKYGVWLVYPKQQQIPQKTRAFIDFIKQEISAQGETSRRTWAQNL